MTSLFAIISQGGIVMIPLLLCSVVSLTVIIEGWIFWRRERPKEDPDRILSFIEKGDFAEALHIAQQGGGMMARVLISGILHRNPSPTEAMEAQALEEVSRMKRYLPVLDTIITLAPLLGTVTGMIQSFQIMGTSGSANPMPSPEVLGRP